MKLPCSAFSVSSNAARKYSQRHNFMPNTTTDYSVSAPKEVKNAVQFRQQKISPSNKFTNYSLNAFFFLLAQAQAENVNGRKVRTNSFANSIRNGTWNNPYSVLFSWHPFIHSLILSICRFTSLHSMKIWPNHSVIIIDIAESKQVSRNAHRINN